MAQRLRICASTVGGTGSIPGWGTKILHVVWWVQSKKKKKSSGYPRPVFPQTSAGCSQLHRPPLAHLSHFCDLPASVAAEFETTMLALGHSVPSPATPPPNSGLLPLSPRLSNSLPSHSQPLQLFTFSFLYLHDMPMRWLQEGASLPGPKSGLLSNPRK